MKLTDILNGAKESAPHFTVDFEINEKDGSKSERTLTLYNIIRTREDERDELSKEFSRIFEERATAAEKKAKASGLRTLSNRIESALRCVADDVAIFDELVSVLDKDGPEYDVYMDHLFIHYVTETRLGEASASQDS